MKINANFVFILNSSSLNNTSKGEYLMDKSSIRKKIISERDKIDIKEKRYKDNKIKEKLMETKYYKECEKIFIYIGFGSEINTYEYIQDFFKDNKRIFVPRTNIKNKTMEAVEINDLNNLEKNKYGILEPSLDKEQIDKNEIELIILPGVAFDKVGGRIGYGGGYYDKFLKNVSSKAIKVALAYDLQVLDKIPMEEHDIKYDYLITN